MPKKRNLCLLKKGSVVAISIMVVVSQKQHFPYRELEEKIDTAVAYLSLAQRVETEAASLALSKNDNLPTRTYFLKPDRQLIFCQVSFPF